MWPLLLLTAVVIFISYVLRKISLELQFWRRTGVKFIGFFEACKDNYRLITTPVPDHTLDSYRRYGKVCGTYVGIEPSIWIGDPVLLKDVFIKKFNYFADRLRAQKVNHPVWDNLVQNMSGEEWRYVRSIMSPSLSTGKMKLMINTVSKVADNTVENVLHFARQETPICIKEVFGAFSLDTIARLAFAVNLNSHKDMQNPFVAHAKEAFGSSGATRLFFSQVFPWVFKLFRLAVIPQFVIDFYSSFLKTIIEKRKSDPKEDGVDYLELLLATEKKLRQSELSESGSLSEKDKTLQKIFDMDCVVAQAVMFFLAAYDTTGSALSFLFYELALNEDAQDKLIREIDKNIETEDDITYEKILQMPYLDAVINENFRKNTLVPMLPRVCTSDVTLGEYHIEKGTTISIPIHALHHDPEYYPEPETFKPERFLPENKSSLVPFTFLPFGEGPRHCLGMRLALMDIKVVVIKLLKKVKFQRLPETQVPLTIRTRAFLIETVQEIKLKAVPRVR